MTPVKSSNISAIDYVGDGNEGLLTVAFNNGTVYAYQEVPDAVWQGLLQADSKGSYLAKHIKDKYRFSRVV